LFVGGAWQVALGDLATVKLGDGTVRLGEVLEVRSGLAVVQVLGDVQGIDTARTEGRFQGHSARFGVSRHVLGRSFNGLGETIDGGADVMPEAWADVNGLPLNPSAREQPSEPIQTGISAIDGLNTLLRGQKLPIFGGFGLPTNDLAVRIATSAEVGAGEPFCVIFAAIGITHREAAYFRTAFVEAGVMPRSVLFLSLASAPAMERLLTPRFGLTVAEHLAFGCGMHVLVVMTDMTNYCESLRELGAAREEVPGRRGYPGYMYTDLAALYERAGRVRGTTGSITQIPLVSMPDDDITHPVPDLTGYITEGQIVLSRDLHRRGIFPPIDVLPSLSRLMGHGIGVGKTRADHRALADQLYAAYARGREIRRLQAILGEAALSEVDRAYLRLADAFEAEFISQKEQRREIEATLGLGWRLLRQIPRSELTRVAAPILDQYYEAEISPA
jgi:V/A-type H+-transporting ATPase subunit B